MSEWENVRKGKFQNGKISEFLGKISEFFIWGKFPNFVKYENFQKLGKIHLKNHQN